MRSKLTFIAMLLGLTWPGFARADEDVTDVFFKTCMATIGNFPKVSEIAPKFDFLDEGKMWTRKSDSASILLKEAPDRHVCMMMVIGDHFADFKAGVERNLKSGFAGAFEPKEYQGQTLYLVRDMNENVIVQVIPPFGASTIIAANVRKQ